jgi:hypothetical protein
MLEHLIRKNKPIPVWSGVRRLNSGNFEVGEKPAQHGLRRIMDQRPVMSPADFVHASRFTNKQFYSNWLEEMKPYFPKGRLLTLKMYPIVPDRKNPPFFFIVHMMQEVRHLCQWDQITKEPRAVGMMPGDKEGIYCFVSPSSTRDLTEEELKLVHLHHPEIEARIAEIVRIAEPSAPANDDGPDYSAA